jgi:hypothetical protein
MSATLPRPGASYSHAHHAIYFKPGWLAPSDDPGLEAARERHEALAANLKAATDRQRALPAEHSRLARRRQDAFDARARGEDMALPAVPSADKLAAELQDAEARVDAARSALAEHVGATLAMIDARRATLRAAFSARADAITPELVEARARVRALQEEQANALLPVRWLDATRPGRPDPPRFDDLAARDPAIIEAWRREATGERTDADRLARDLGTGVYDESGDAPEED